METTTDRISTTAAAASSKIDADRPAPRAQEASADAAAGQPHDSGDASVDDEATAAGSIDKIRDILFGIHMRDYEKRFARLEDRLVREAAALRDETNRRFEELQAFVKQEFAGLSQRLISEQDSRSNAVQDLSRHIQELLQHVDRRTAQMDEQSGKSFESVQERLGNESRQLADEIRARFEAVTASLDQHAATLRHDKTDRAFLATLFQDLALQLTGGAREAR